MNKKLIYGIGIAIILAGAYVGLRPSASDSAVSEVTVKAVKGEFRIEVNTSGELEAKNSVKILGPRGLQQAGIWEVKLDNIIPEGTVVKKGDHIARLDQSQVGAKIQSAQNDLKLALSQQSQTRLDTALELRKARDELVNLAYAVDEKDIVLQQSQFEPPATIKNNEIQLEKAKRAHTQAKENYELQVEKAIAQMEEKAATVSDAQQQFDFLTELSTQFNILAPEAGMVIYKRNWRGEKQGVGSTIGAWDPTVATLPDLSLMVSKIYINEVDISTVKVGQDVGITLDAFPDKKLTGRVVEVANVGEQKPNSDSKVFEALVEIHESDTTLRPGMTTGNTIIADVLDNVIAVPIESIHNQGDSLLFVVKKNGLSNIRQQIIAGKSDSDFTVILEGITEGDIIFLSDLENINDLKLEILNSEEVASNQ